MKHSRGSVVRLQQGVTYLGVLLLIALLGATAGGYATLATATLRQEKRLDYVAAADEIDAAILQYAQRSPGTTKQYPKALADLLNDARAAGVQRYLRQIPVNPYTGKREWALVRDAQGAILGVLRGR